MRITADTGILVRANTNATGPARRLLDEIVDSPHRLVLSEFLLEETRRVLGYTRMQRLYDLGDEDIEEHIAFLTSSSDMVPYIVEHAVILTDPDDDPVLWTAVHGHADVICTLDRDFYQPNVLRFCKDRGIDVTDDVALLRLLRTG